MKEGGQQWHKKKRRVAALRIPPKWQVVKSAVKSTGNSRDAVEKKLSSK